MLFYLPRLFVYHAENREKGEFVSVVKIMEYKLIKYIGNPAMCTTALSGGYLAYITDYLSNSGWLHIKILLVVTLVIYHFYLEKLRKRLESGECLKSGKFFRFINEYPTLIMIAVVVLVIFKPF